MTTMTPKMILVGTNSEGTVYFKLDKTTNEGVLVSGNSIRPMSFWSYLSKAPPIVPASPFPFHVELLSCQVSSAEWSKKFFEKDFSKEDLKDVSFLITEVPETVVVGESIDVLDDESLSAKTKSLIGLEVKAKRVPLKAEPYDPDARDGDNDGIVQENTPWERPAATRLMDAAGKLIERGKESSSRPSGIRVVDADGNDVDYTPTYERSRAGTIGAGRQVGESTSKPRKPEPKKPVVDKPTQEQPEVKPKKPGSGSALSDHGAGSLKERGLRDVRSAAAPPPPEPPKPDVPKPDMPEGDYRMTHQPSDDGPRAFDLTEDGGGGWWMPDDVYDKPNQYTGADATVRKETMEQLERVRGNPDGLVTVYRYAPEGREFEVGNWVSLSRTYAEQHGASNPTPGGTVQSMQVPAREVRFAGDDLAEFGWHPEPVKKSVFPPSKRTRKGSDAK